MKVAKPLSGRLSSIPKSKLFTLETASVLSDISEKLEEVGIALAANNHDEARWVRQKSKNILSIAQAVEDGHADLAMLRTARDVLKQYDAKLNDINFGLADNRALATADVRLSTVIDQLGVELSNYVNSTEEDAGALEADLKKTLKLAAERNRTLRSHLPRSSVKKYAICRLPVIPVTERFAKDMSEKLRRAGFDAQPFEDYTMLNDQLLIAVRHEYMKAWDEEYSDGTFTVVDSILEVLNNSSSTKYAFVSETPKNVPSSRGFLYYWVMPETYLTKLVSVTGAIDNWGPAVS